MNKKTRYQDFVLIIKESYYIKHFTWSQKPLHNINISNVEVKGLELFKVLILK